jgi:hypothetical protein
MIGNYRHSIITFNERGVLAAVGIQASNPNYLNLYEEVTGIIEAQLMVSARTLNELLTEEYVAAMGTLPEYTRLPSYSTVLAEAMANPRHQAVYNYGGVYQVKFVDFGILGDEKDAQEIQLAAYSNAGEGNISGWIRLYHEWLNGTNNSIGTTLEIRASLMLEAGNAPFVTFIENGNGDAAYPTNGPCDVYRNFRPTYLTEMQDAYERVIATTETLTASESQSFPDMYTATAEVNGQSISGMSWTAKSGNTVLLTSTSTDASGKITGQGYLLNSEGDVISRWGGWLPQGD